MVCKTFTIPGGSGRVPEDPEPEPPQESPNKIFGVDRNALMLLGAVGAGTAIATVAGNKKKSNKRSNNR